MVKNVGAEAPLAFELIAGGRSNLTFSVTDSAGTRYALRRPPVSHVLPTAHDMVREHTLISALYPQGVPVPEPLGLCVDESVNGSPFYVMEFVDGAILRDAAGAEAAFEVATRAMIGDQWPRPWLVCTTSTSRRRGWAASRATRATSSDSCGAGAPSSTR